ncbi:MAG: ATP-binding protein [Acidobacteria bacterium]|nr:ATP-binding protein [Acidobacteriota bacterium]
MIDRLIQTTVTARLRQFPAVALIGPRQVGKTTLARRLAGAADGSVYLDLEDPADRAKLADAAGYLRASRRRLVVIDEVQRAPGLFEVLRVLIDERIRAGERSGQFLILGSAAPDLLRQSGESLAGRIAYLELAPLDVREAGGDLTSRLWVRGGFPPSFLAESDWQSAEWREQFIRTYLERDVPQLGPRVPAETLRRLWTMLAHGQGGVLNMAVLARSLAVDGKTVSRYVDLLADLFLVRRLPPFHANVRKRLVKSPKIYVRDSGVVHTLLRLDDENSVLGHPVAGASWEGFVVETLIRAAPDRARAAFYRTATGVEVDLLLELPGNRLWAIEIKRASAPRVERGLRVAVDDLQPDRTFVVHSGEERYPMGGGVEAVGLTALADALASLRPPGGAGEARERPRSGSARAP